MLLKINILGDEGYNGGWIIGVRKKWGENWNLKYFSFM